MATLIICPACDTRYETKAVFPPEGRKVRCSKCGHVWQALPVTVPSPAKPVQMTPQLPAQTARPPQAPPPKPAAVNAGLSEFAGIAPVAPSAPPAPPPPFQPSFTQPGIDAELAAQLARLNAEAMSEAPPAAPPEKSGGIFARLSGKRPAAPVAPLPDTGMSDAAMGDASFDSDMMGAGIGNGMADASMGDAGMDADLGFDPALTAQALPGEQPPGPRHIPSIVTIGWLLLALVVASVIGTLVLAPSAVMSVLPGAARLYALFGAPVGAHGLAFEGVRYGWTSEGGQTVLEVQGDVVNLTAAPVDVPTVVIALRDEKGEEISEWTTEVGEEELAGGEHAPFLRQIPSPPSNVRSVKVRFAKAE
ncbi:MAG: zinc-ribbon domain-containing protein [Methyloceanibacter sp.]